MSKKRRQYSPADKFKVAMELEWLKKKIAQFH
jgi:hypothetical protein